MPFSMGAAALAALLSSAAALPANAVAEAPATPTNVQVLVPQVSTGKIFINGPVQVNNTWNKFGIVPPANVIAAANAAQKGSVTASPEQYDEAYLCPVTLGNSKVVLDFDTGSADLWAFSTETPQSEAKGHALYNTASGTKLKGYTWRIKYADKSGARGNVFADKVVVGSVTATRQAVEAATSVSAQFVEDTPNDGILGLAFSSINQVKPVQQTTFFDTVKSTLAQKLFTANLKKGEPGSYTFGYIDSSAYSGSISYVPVDTTNGFWEFTAGGYSVGSGSTSGSLGDSIADTGTTLLYIPAAAAKAYYAKVSGASYSSNDGGYILPCSSNPPNFNVKIGSGTFTVPGSYVIYAPLSSGSTTCFGGIQSSAGIGFNIFGDIFLKSVYAIFDETQSSPRLGFAKKS